VDYPAEQTCCGQPAFNSGYHAEAVELAQRFLGVFRSSQYIVAPSGSCTSMVKMFYPEILEDPSLHELLHDITTKTYEFSDFLVNVMGVKDLGVHFPHKVTYHDACHLLRELKVKDPPRDLLRHVRGLELVEMEECESCCGFGGTFSVKYPEISTAMAEDKAASWKGAKYVVANDSSCLMQIGGSLNRKVLRETTASPISRRKPIRKASRIPANANAVRS
jgi:L-lactate dehydrogenase complex protein LldE